MLLYIVTKFGTDWFVFVDAREYKKSNKEIFPSSNNSSCSSPIGPMIKLIQIVFGINILLKFSADWPILADDRV